MVCGPGQDAELANLGSGVNEDEEWFGPRQDAELANLGSGVNEDEEWFGPGQDAVGVSDISCVNSLSPIVHNN